MDNYRICTDWYFLKMAFLVSERATCARRKVGCVIVNSKNHVVATGV
jgi:deoxycytidylate deaminase